MKGDDIKSNIYAFNILMTIISLDQAKAKYLSDISEEYTKKLITIIYSKIKLKTRDLILINIILIFVIQKDFQY